MFHAFEGVDLESRLQMLKFETHVGVEFPIEMKLLFSMRNPNSEAISLVIRWDVSLNKSYEI